MPNLCGHHHDSEALRSGRERKRKRDSLPSPLLDKRPFLILRLEKGLLFYVFFFSFQSIPGGQLQDLAHPWIKAKIYGKEKPSNLTAIPVALQILTFLLNLLATVHFSEFLASCYCVLSEGFSYNQWERLSWARYVLISTRSSVMTI